MANFRPDGHLTDEALQALAAGAPMEELERLEAAEHLAFCDQCLLRYTRMLTPPTLLEPPAELEQTLWRRLRRKTAQLLMSRYATAAAGIVLVTALWAGGIFQGLMNSTLELSGPAEGPTVFQEEFSTWPERYTQALQEGFSGLRDWWFDFGKNGGRETAPDDSVQGGQVR